MALAVLLQAVLKKSDLKMLYEQTFKMFKPPKLFFSSERKKWLNFVEESFTQRKSILLCHVN